MKLRVLDLFSGIGGFSLGLERTGGFETVAFCEIEEFPRTALRRHWPGVRIYGDVRQLTADVLERDGIQVDVICGGFPCQDISNAGARAGIDGKRSGLWSEYARLIGELRPRYAIVENVAALLGRGLERVLGDLAAIGYDAEWHCIPASAVGAPHRRDRLWIVAHPNKLSEWRGAGWREAAEWRPRDDIGRSSHYAEDDADAMRARLQGGGHVGEAPTGARAGQSLFADACLGGQWEPEPDVGRVAHGVPDRVDRLKALGNAVVPQIPELIGRAILAHAESV